MERVCESVCNPEFGAQDNAWLNAEHIHQCNRMCVCVCAICLLRYQSAVPTADLRC